MAGVVKSVETFVASITNGNHSKAVPWTDTLGETQDIANCVPFVTKRFVSGSVYEAEAGQMDVWFTSTDTLNVGRDNTANAYEVEVSVVEFDDTLCNIYSGSFQQASGTTTDQYAIGATVDTSKSFLVFHSLQDASSGVEYTTHLFRGRITDSAGDPGGTHLTFDRAVSNGTADGHWYVVECIGTDFAVDFLDVSLSAAQTTNTGSISVDADTTLLLGSWSSSTTNSSDNTYNTCDISFTDTVVTVQRSGADGVIEWSGFAVDFADGTTAQHGTIAAQGSTSPDDETLTTPVDAARSTALMTGNMGSTTAGSFPGAEAADIADAQIQLTLRDSDSGGDFDEVRVQHSTIGVESNNDISWSVIEWGHGAGPSVVISVNQYSVADVGTAGAETAIDVSSLTPGVDLDNCVPFVTTRVDTVGDFPDDIRDYTVRCWIDVGAEEILLARDTDFNSVVDAEVYLVEFDGTKCQVITDSFQIASDTGYQTEAFTFPASATVTVANAFAVFSSYQNPSVQFYPNFQLRGRITSTTQITFDREESNGTIDGQYYIVEATSGDFTVDTLDITIAAASSTNTGSPDVLAATTLMLGSYRVDTASSSVSNADNCCNAILNLAGDTVTLTRTGTTGALTWHGQLIKFTDGTTVSRGTENQATALATDDITVALDDYTFALPVFAGQMGNIASGADFAGTTDDDVPDAFMALKLTSNTVLNVQKSTNGGELGHDITWEVVQFIEGAPAAGTRRVIIIS